MAQIIMILKPSKSAQQIQNFSSTSFTTRRLQLSLKKANMYSDQVYQNLVQSQQENQLLKPANTSYSDQRIYLIYGKTSSLKKAPLNQMYEPKKQIQLSQDNQMMELLDLKSGFISSLHQKCNQEISEYLMLQQKMFELKRKIYEQRKLKDKIHLRNCKFTNESDKSLKNTQILKDKSRQNLILICLLASQCNQLDIQWDQAQKMNRKTAIKIQEQSKTISKLKKQIYQHKMQVDPQVNRLTQLKDLQTIEYRKMTNFYRKMNQLKQEKALLLNYIRTDILSQT